jgi:hypothetical protein
MNFHPLKTRLALAAATACLCAPLAANAADTKAEVKADARSAAHEVKSDAKAAAAEVKADTKAAVADAKSAVNDRDDRMGYSDRAHMKAWSSEKERLEHELKTGQAKSYYPKALADQGYRITSINTDKADKVEYEVVKGKQSYEVQIDFDKSGKSSKVDVDTNMWRAAATKAAMSGKDVPVATKADPANANYSDRAHMKAWNGEKDRLEKSLALGHDPAYYREQLKKMGYQVTSVNDREKDYVEYEVVKGDNSYEVQIDFDGGKAKKVDVATNMWQSEATERALAGKR